MLSFLTPYIAKLGIAAAVLAAAVGAWLYVSRLQSELVAAHAQVAAASATCANTQQTAAAATNATTQVATTTQHMALDNAFTNLLTANQTNQNIGVAALTTITTQAAQPSQDAPIAPVLQSAIAAVRAGQ